MKRNSWFISVLLLIVLLLILGFKNFNDRAGTLLDGDKPDILFNQGEAGYACFRIPTVVVSNSGAILAFCEARKYGCSDTGDIDLVMKKSLDNGVTWSKLKIIWDDNNNVCGNPAPVVDKETGRIHVLATWNNGEDHETEIINGTSIDSRMVYQLTSEDDGETWSQPKNITKHVKLDNWSWYATGPVHGIQLKHKNYKGRLLIPCDHIEQGSNRYFSHVIYSDDQGVTWQLGGTTPKDKVNECSVAELSNGDLMLNMRNYYRDSLKARQTAISKDGGKTWIHQQFDKGLPEPRCQGALLTVNRNDNKLLLFTNPSDPDSRVNMTLSVSYDEGLTWGNKITIYKSHSAYSDLAELGNGDIFILYEAGIKSPYESIRYATMPKSEL